MFGRRLEAHTVAIDEVGGRFAGTKALGWQLMVALRFPIVSTKGGLFVHVRPICFAGE